MNQDEKQTIANYIKPIDITIVNEEMSKLEAIGKQLLECVPVVISERSRIGNNVVDFFTFSQRLETKGKYGVSFYEFVEQFDERFREKLFIKNMLTYYENIKNKNGKKNKYVVLKEVYNICISAINIMRPLNCMEIYSKYGAKKVLNFCAGWGGSMVAAAALNLDAFYGIEINSDLRRPYECMMNYLRGRSPSTAYRIDFCDASSYDYSQLEYDMVFSSPPYYSLERYPNNIEYTSKGDMNERFYLPTFRETYKYLAVGGTYVINVCREVYENVLVPLLGDANEIFPLKKSKRQNNYNEMVYVWKKTKL